MVETEKQAFIDKMYRDRVYILDFLKVYNQLIQAAYTKQYPANICIC